MLAELVLSYFLINTDPIYLRTAYCPCATMKVAVHVNKEYTNGIFIDVEPYVLRDLSSGVTGQAGAKLKIGTHIKDVDLSLFHESIHNLDENFGLPIEMDGVEVRWRLSK